MPASCRTRRGRRARISRERSWGCAARTWREPASRRTSISSNTKRQRNEYMSRPRNENQIDYIELPASHIEATKQFYGAVFGWTFEDYGPDYTSFFDGRLAGGFTKDTSTPSHGMLLVIYGGDLAAAQQKIKAAGGV